MMIDPERSLEPPEPKVDGALQCCECEETIPGDSYYFDICTSARSA